MKLTGLLHRSRPELPGLAGTARVDKRTDALLKRLKPGIATERTRTTGTVR